MCGYKKWKLGFISSQIGHYNIFAYFVPVGLQKSTSSCKLTKFYLRKIIKNSNPIEFFKMYHLYKGIQGVSLKNC